MNTSFYHLSVISIWKQRDNCIQTKNVNEYITCPAIPQTDSHVLTAPPKYMFNIPNMTI